MQQYLKNYDQNLETSNRHQSPTKRIRMSTDSDCGSVSNLEKALTVSSFPLRSFASITLAGKKAIAWENQDSLIMGEDSVTRSILLGCLDGHGEHGARISQFFQRSLPCKLFNHRTFDTAPLEAIEDVVSHTEFELRCSRDIDTRFSGTTLCLAVVRENRLLVANVGDSRACLGVLQASETDRGDENYGCLESKTSQAVCLAIPLSRDHKPSIPEEFARVTENGGRVCCLDAKETDWGPMRVWLPRINAPGLAMSRSLCDDVVHTAGVSSRLEFYEHVFDKSRDAALIVASDGLWDHMTNQEAIDICLDCMEPDLAAAKLIKEARRRCLASSDTADDVSVCVAFLSGHPNSS